MGVGEVMFKYERDMTEPARAWLHEQTRFTMIEYATPWGICDLVGCSFDSIAAMYRKRDRQATPLTPSTTLRKLWRLHVAGSGGLPNANASDTYDALWKKRMVSVDALDCARSKVRWLPLHNRLIALELKISRVSEVLRQAEGNLEMAGESWIGLPLSLAEKVVANDGYVKFGSQGIGVLGVTPSGCQVVLKARPQKPKLKHVTEMIVVEAFWRKHHRNLYEFQG